METATTAAPAADFAAVLAGVHALGKGVIAPSADDVDAKARFPREAFDALKKEQLLSAYVTPEYGGMGLTMTQICRICEVLAIYDASTAMVYAMHQIQVACILHHGQSSEYFRNYLRRLVDEQLLLASATTEIGVGGDLRTSKCCVE
ncbi:MAG: acyl-CoA/acyl-ACP dehydrogenase, partial [Gemmatimonadota bacterium]|nr:acyl-CoA/acyl-ACP dehydrogenase [Gemmatimonadota bacterium]